MELEKSNIDRKLLGLARKSPVEIAELTGLEPGYVAERITFLLSSKDWLSDLQNELLLIEEAHALKDKANEFMNGIEDPRDFAGVANVVLRSLKLVSERLDARRKLVDEDITRITAAHAKVFAQAFDTALQYIVAGFKAFDGVPSDGEVDDLVEQGLKRAGSVLSASIFE